MLAVSLPDEYTKLLRNLPHQSRNAIGVFEVHRCYKICYTKSEQTNVLSARLLYIEISLRRKEKKSLNLEKNVKSGNIL